AAVRRGVPGRGGSAAGVYATFSTFWVGRARRRRDLGRRRRNGTRSGGQGGRAGGWRRPRHFQSARDLSHLGAGDGAADLQRHRLAGPAHGRTLRGTARGGARVGYLREDWVAAPSVFLCDEDRPGLGSRARRAPRGGRG